MQLDSKKIWQEIENKTEQFANLHLQQNLDYEKFTIYSIITHSTAIEGSTHLKIPEKIDEFCENLNRKLNAKPQNLKELYEITFNAHLDLATIHPWADGNGRTARLLMNFLQFHFKIVPTKIFLEDRAEYIASLRESQEAEDNSHFLNFMALEHLKTLESQIIPNPTYLNSF